MHEIFAWQQSIDWHGGNKNCIHTKTRISGFKKWPFISLRDFKSKYWTPLQLSCDNNVLINKKKKEKDRLTQLIGTMNFQEQILLEYWKSS